MTEIFEIPAEDVLLATFILGAFFGVIWCVFLYTLECIIVFIKNKKK